MRLRSYSVSAGRSARRQNAGRLLRLFAISVLLAGIASLAPVAQAQQPKAEEYQVKAVYLFNFGRFIQWPPSSETTKTDATKVETAKSDTTKPDATKPDAVKDDSFAICILGRDPFGALLDSTLAGEAIDNKKLIARRIVAAQDAANCRILYVSTSEAARLKQILDAVENTGVLTVSDIPDFTANGGMIQFVLKENKVRFEVNLTAAEKAKLMLSSQLLKVATVVRKD